MKKILWRKVNSFLENYSDEALGEFRKCPICKSGKFKSIHELAGFQFYSDSSNNPKHFDIKEVICKECYSIYLNPCYTNYGFSVLFAEAGMSYGSMLQHTHEQIDWLKKYELLNTGTRILDVGCYEGYFLSKLPNDVIKLGVDIDEPAITRGLQKYKEKKIQLFLGDFESFDYKGIEPDTITMYHVLEHLPRPVEVLKKLLSISKNTTKLVIEIPILENGKTNDINGFFSVQHTTHFSKNSINNCLSIAGWDIENHFELPDYNGYRVIASPRKDCNNYVLKKSQEDWMKLNEVIVSWHRAIGEVEKTIQKIPLCKYIIIWGAGAHTEFLYQLTSLFYIRSEIEFIIVDSDPIKHGNTWRGINIYDPCIIKDFSSTSTMLLISSYSGQESIFEAAVSLNFPSNNIIKLYDSISRY